MDFSTANSTREMNTISAWDATRWRGNQDQNYYDQAQPLQHPTSRAFQSDARNPSIASYPDIGKRSANFHGEHPQSISSSALKDPPSMHASAYHSGLHERHTPPTDGLDGPQKLPNFSSNVSPWLNQGYDQSSDGKDRPVATVPLTLHIPKDQELPRIATVFGRPVHDERSYSSHDHRSTSSSSTTLPSFASLEKHANCTDSLDEADGASMPSRAPCHTYAQLQPMVVEIATAVAELDESMQRFFKGSASRIPECPKDSLTRAVQWILTRLRSSKADLQAAARTPQTGAGHQETPISLSGVASRNISPSNPLKRQADPWEHEESPDQKRPHAGNSPDQGFKAQGNMAGERQASSQYNSRDPTRPSNISSPPAESAPGSAYPRAQSPGLPGRSFRALPSPSSVAYPPSAAPSIAPHTTHSAGSPTTSHAYEVSIHTTSTDSATSAHIAELQHQVTLKSLSLQTLQSEYSSLLQKVQRLNVKTQTMERKGNVADQEVNELTNKNDDLTQQLEALQQQFDESEKRRESDREEATREKDQWMQMLDQSRRLQAKVELDKKSLAQRIATLQSECERLQKDQVSLDATERGKPGRPEGQVRHDSGRTSDISFISSTLGRIGQASDNVVALKAHIEVLQSALEEAKAHHLRLDERTHEILRRSSEIGNVIDRALQGGVVLDEVRITEATVDRNDTASTRTTYQQRAASSWVFGPGDHTALAGHQASSASTFGPFASLSSGAGPTWRAQEYVEGPPEIHSFRPLIGGPDSTEQDGRRIPNDQRGASHNDRGSPTSSHGGSTSSTSGTATQRSPKTYEAESMNTTPIDSHNSTRAPTSISSSISRNTTDGKNQEQTAEERRSTTAKEVDAYTIMPPPPRPIS